VLINKLLQGMGVGFMETARRLETLHHRPYSAALMRLRAAGLRPTKQRMALAKLLFDRSATRHVTAEQLYSEATAVGTQVSLATIYNTLHQFTEVGLLREVIIEPSRVHFDSNTTRHHHILNITTGEVECVEANQVDFNRMPKLPQGTEIDQVEVVIRVRSSNAPSPAGNDNE
jgi:Fur family transcriptional regulator, iron response regulator